MFLEAILLIGVAWLGLLPQNSLYDLFHALMMPAMLIPMLLRLDLYTGGMGHHAHAG